jgi:hypothetical protein
MPTKVLDTPPPLLLRRPDKHGRGGILVIVKGRLSTTYDLRLIPADWGRGFELRKWQKGLSVIYHVNIDDEGHDSCDCLGHTQHGHCKHVEAIRALMGKM